MSKADSLRSGLKQTATSEENKEKQHMAHQALLSNERRNEPSNVSTNARTNVQTNQKVERRRFSFDLRPELHRQLKMQCLLDDTNMYEVLESIIEQYLDERKNEGSNER